MLYLPIVRRHRRLSIVIAIIAAVTLLTAVCYKLAVDFVYNHPLSDPNVGFRYMEPAYLPDEYRITGKRLVLDRGNSGAVMHKLLYASAELNIGTHDWIYGISESRADSQDAHQAVLTTTNTYDPASIKPTCSQQLSPHGRIFRLCHWVDWGTLDVYEVRTRADGTFIQATFPAAKGITIPVQKFGQFVDSFAPANPVGLPIIGGGA